jgi:hypothetical protein
MDKDKFKRNSNAKIKQKNNSLNDKYNIKTFLKKRQLKTLSNNNVSNKINKAKKENTLIDINHLLNHRYSCIIQGNKNIIINNKRLTIRRTSRKKIKALNLTNNNNNKYLKDSFNKTISKIIKSNSQERNNSKKKSTERFSINNNELRKYNVNRTMTFNNTKKNNSIRKSIRFRRTTIPYNNNKINKNLDINKKKEELKDINENNIKRLYNSEYIFEKKNTVLEKNQNQNNKKEKKNIYTPICQINTNEHELDKFFNQNNNNIITNEDIRFSNISKINNNDNLYLNNKNNLIDNNYNNKEINVNESNDLYEFEKNLLDEINNNENIQKEKEVKNNNIIDKTSEIIISIPCLNCDKLINIDEIDEHSNKCFNTKKNNNIKENSDDYITIIENKLKNILEYLEKLGNNNIFDNNISKMEFNEHFEIIEGLKLNINKILEIKEFNFSSIDELNKINNIFSNSMEKCLNSPNVFTLLNRAKILLEEKKNFFLKKIKKNNNNNIEGGISKNKNLAEHSLEEIMSESETMEFLDLKKMEKILDEKELKTENLDKLINEAKNKRLFLMEVLKVKYQKIKENENEDLIEPEMIWKEAVKKNIEMKNWTEFIFNELNNPNKYLKMIKKGNNTNKKKK